MIRGRGKGSILEMPRSSGVGPGALLMGAEGSSKVSNLFKRVPHDYKLLFPELSH